MSNYAEKNRLSIITYSTDVILFYAVKYVVKKEGLSVLEKYSLIKQCNI